MKLSKELLEKTEVTTAVLATRVISDMVFVLHAVDVSSFSDDKSKPLTVIHVGIVTEIGAEPFNDFSFEKSKEDSIDDCIVAIENQIKAHDAFMEEQFNELKNFSKNLSS